MQPTYVEVALPDGHRFSAICKFPTRENRAPAESVINEWIGCQAASIAGVQAPPCFIVEASPHVILHLVEKHGISVASPFGFASEVCQIDSIVYPTTLCAMTQEDLTRLFCFDMLFINADRTPNNPNCGQAMRRLFAYDFGSSLLSPKTPTNSFDRYFFGPGMADRASAHLCKEYIGSQELAQSVLCDMVDKVCKNRWFADLKPKHLPGGSAGSPGKLVVEYADYVST